MKGEASVCYECSSAIVTPTFTTIGRRIVRVGKEAAEHDDRGEGKRKEGQSKLSPKREGGMVRLRGSPLLITQYRRLERESDCGKDGEEGDTAGSEDAGGSGTTGLVAGGIDCVLRRIGSTEDGDSGILS